MIRNLAQNALSCLVRASSGLLETAGVWLRPPQISRHSLGVVLVMLAIAIIGNTLVRGQQLSEWHAVSESLFFNNESMFSTADAPYFLGHAKSIHVGETLEDFDTKRLYPNLAIADPENKAGHSLRARPLLSVLLSRTYDFMEGSDLVTSANLMILITAAADRPDDCNLLWCRRVLAGRNRCEPWRRAFRGVSHALFHRPHRY